MFEERRPSDTSKLAMLLFRIGIVAVFFVMVGRMVQLQVMRQDEYRTLADTNRLVRLETASPRGVIYDRNDTILVRNRPSFEIAVVPADLTQDDIETEAVDEEAQEIELVLRMLRADSDTDVALRIGEIMFRKLGYSDFTRTVQNAGVPITFVDAPAQVRPFIEEDRLVKTAPEQVFFPDLTAPLPIEGLVALVQRAVTIERQGSASDPVPILDGLDRIRAFEISEESFTLPALRVNQVPVREYIYGDLLSHVLGFMGPIPAIAADDYRETGYNDPNEKVGLNGLEYSYQDELRGSPGVRFVERDILGTDVRIVGDVLDPVPGLNLHLSLDRRLQEVMKQELQVAMDDKEAPWAVAIAMNPQNGQILGMVSLPSYDNNIFAERIGEDYLKLEQDERRPLINYAIGGLYPPGSTFKMVTASAGLAEGVITPDTTVVDSGPIFLANEYFPNDLSQAQKFVSWNHLRGIVHGKINIVDALTLSNDIFFYYLGGGFPEQFEGLGQRRLSKWAELYGFGDVTGIDLPGEVTSIIPTDQWKRQLFAEIWTTGDSYNMAIGQGYMLSTPLQVLQEAATVANGGAIYAPQIVHHMTDANGGVQKDFAPKIIRRLPMSDEDMQVVRQGMWNVVNAPNGTGAIARVPGVTSAGKTGTAEFCEYLPEEQDCRRVKDDVNGDHLPTHAWYTGFAPYENPEIAVVVFVYDGGEGSQTAAPVAQKILEAYFTEIAPRPLQETVQE
ncbi:MAG: penicillin-binding protein 2 [Caldilineaceae bacterium]|nr:penicillin-binding protein 2 [Caldilineaceae bacterium]